MPSEEWMLKRTELSAVSDVILGSIEVKTEK